MEIAKTGYWPAELAHDHHYHCAELSAWICNFLSADKERHILDLGCGLGSYLKDLSDAGFLNLTGYEADPPKKKVFDRIEAVDLTVPFTAAIRGNVISLEVGEHIPYEYQDIYIDNVTRNCSNYLIFSWAARGQHGTGHVNCLDNHEIIPEIEKRGFKLLEQETASARGIDPGPAEYFKNTLMIFKNQLA